MVLNALDWIFIKAISICLCIELLLTLTSLSVPAAEKHPHSMRLRPAHFTFGMYSACDEQSWFPSNMMLGIEIHQTRESCFTESDDPLGAFLQIRSVFSCVFTEERIEFGNTAIKPRSM